MLPALLGTSTYTLRAHFSPDAPLVRSGLVSVGHDGELRIIKRLQRLATAPGVGTSDVNRLLLDSASESRLDWCDFDYVARGRDLATSILKGALESREPGTNLLIYGPPGSGKTELCKVLAARLGLTLYTVGEAPEDDDRLKELRLAQHILTQDRRALLLFDEMEDFVPDAWWDNTFTWPFGSRSRNKNRILEDTPVPILWTVNDLELVPPVMRRRMTYALRLSLPKAGIGERILARQLTINGIQARADETRALAAEFAAVPGVAAGAAAAARLAGGGIEAVTRVMRSQSRLLAPGKPPQATPARFDLSLIQADTDPAELSDRLVKSGERRVSLCLQGPPGTGKSAFIRYLAERLGLEVVQKRASDLLSMWIGETEQQIADTFAEARDTGAFLVFDEADSLLADRRFAERTWEVSQVNEMLTWMESHPLPFACTTNLSDSFDPATLRRFVFKIALGYLTPEQAAAAFRGYFALAPPASVTSLAILTPGDFAVVRRKAEVLGQLGDSEALAAMLRSECDAKRERTRGIGFSASFAVGQF